MRSWAQMLVVSTLLGGFGCGTIDREADCRRLCEKKQGCVDKSYDVGDCVDYGWSHAESSRDYGQMVKDCSACVETRACAEAVECLLESTCPALP